MHVAEYISIIFEANNVSLVRVELDEAEICVENVDAERHVAVGMSDVEEVNEVAAEDKRRRTDYRK